MRFPYELSSTVDDVENFTWESYDISLKKGSNKPEDLFFTTIFEAFEAKNKEPKESKVQENLVLLPASSFWLILYKEKYTVCLFFRLFSLFLDLNIKSSFCSLLSSIFFTVWTLGIYCMKENCLRPWCYRYLRTGEITVDFY